MSPLSKFAVFLVLAGVLAVLFAFLPGERPPVIHTEKTEPQSEQSRIERAQPPVRKVSAGEVTGRTQSPATKVENKFPTNVKMPAIRGVNNYGWVELPRGTEVSLVRKSDDGLWVRWDGTIVKLPPVAAASGAVVLRR